MQQISASFCWIEFLNSLFIAFPLHEQRDMISMPTHTYLAVTRSHCPLLNKPHSCKCFVCECVGGWLSVYTLLTATLQQRQKFNVLTRKTFLGNNAETLLQYVATAYRNWKHLSKQKFSSLLAVPLCAPNDVGTALPDRHPMSLAFSVRIHVGCGTVTGRCRPFSGCSTRCT